MKNSQQNLKTKNFEKKIAIIDYGMGNISIQCALKNVGLDSIVTSKKTNSEF